MQAGYRTDQAVRKGVSHQKEITSWYRISHQAVPSTE